MSAPDRFADRHRASALVILVGAAAAGCSQSSNRASVEPATGEPPPPAPTADASNAGVLPTTTAEPSLTWSMSRDGDTLEIAYEFTNTTARPVYVLDVLPIDRAFDPDAVVVMDADVPDTVAFIRGPVPSVNTLFPHALPLPRPTRLEPGDSVKRTAKAPIPLASWHNFAMKERVAPLTSGLTHAVLEVSYSADLDAFKRLPHEADSISRRAPRVRGARLPLPEGVSTRPGAGDAIPELTWSMTVSSSSLVIEYEIANDTAEAIVLYDQLRWRKVVRPELVWVVNAETPDMVAFMRSIFRPHTTMYEPELPEERRVEPGQSVRGRAIAELPLRAWYPKPPTPIPQSARTAVLEIGYLPASEAERLSPRSHRVLRGAVKRLPETVTISRNQPRPLSP